MSNLTRLTQTLVQTTASNQCLTGCLYQVIQTTGLQGSNVLKLLPILKSKDHPFPVVPIPVTPIGPSLDVPPAVISSSPSPPPGPVSVPLVQNNLPNTLHVENPFPGSQDTTVFLDNTQPTLPANSVPESPRIIMKNTKTSIPVKPMPILPSGHSLQIPAHAEVVSVPVSSLPVSIQQKILPQASGTDIGKNSSVIYVSPVNMIKTSNNHSPPPCLGPNISSLACRVKSPSQQKLPPSSDEIAKGPMKWVVQESQESAACLVPVKSSNDTASKILQMLSKTNMEEMNLTRSDQSRVVQIRENALVLCNNKIFFLTRKGSELSDSLSKNLEPPALKPVEPERPAQDLPNKVVQVVLSKNKSPPPSAEELVQSNVVSTAKPKRKSFTPQAVRGDPSVIYIAADDEDDLCRKVSTKPRDDAAACSLPNPASTSVGSAANNRKSKKTKDQKSQDPETPAAETVPAVNVMDDTGWRKKFGLMKNVKIVLKRVPLVCPQETSQATLCLQVDSGSPARHDVTDPEEETEPPQRKRKLSSRERLKASKKQKITEDEDLTPNPLNLGMSDEPPSPSPLSGSYSLPGGRSPSPKTTEQSSSTWSPSYHGGGEASYPSDFADFQVSQDIAGHFSEVSLPSQRFHIDSMYPDETTKDEKIQRLKEVIREREKALEALRCQKT